MGFDNAERKGDHRHFGGVEAPYRFRGLRHLVRDFHELARLVHRNIKNVSEDVKYLAQVGLLELKEADRKVSARVNYDKILLEIAV